MNNKYLNLIKTSWYKEINENYGLTLTDDADGLLSAVIMQNMFNVKITKFYTFNALYVIDDPIEASKETIAVDLDCTSGKGFGNHVTRLLESSEVNPEIINLNTMFPIYANSMQYHKKAATSTLLTIMSLYNCNMDCFDEKAKMLLLAIDSTFLSFYSKYPNDNSACKFYLCDVLGFTDLYEVLKNHKKEEFLALKEEFNLNAKITINKEGYLTTDLDLFYISLVLGLNKFSFIELPKDKFILEKTYKTGYGTLNDIAKVISEGKSIISLAATSKFYNCFSCEA
jgi:hypothetical protein